MELARDFLMIVYPVIIDDSQNFAAREILKVIDDVGENPRRRRSTGEPKTRQGHYKRRRRDNSSKNNAPLLDSSLSSESCSPLHTSTPFKDKNDLSVSSSSASPLYERTKSSDEPSNIDESYNVQSSFDTSFPAPNLSVSFFNEEMNVSDDECRIMKSEESFERYAVIDASPESLEDFYDERNGLDLVNFDDPLQNYLLSSDDENDIELDELMKYCSNDTSEQSQEHNLTNFLREWSCENSITNLALSRLATRLKNHYPECFSSLPVDARTIMRTPVGKLDIVNVPPGQYIHIGIRKQLDFIASILVEQVETLRLLINIDGVKLYKHTSYTLYPILMMVPSCTSLKNKVFPVGLYYGRGKPGDMRLFLSPFINEMIQLLTVNDFSINKRTVKIELLGFCCDTPARSEILETVGHSGFFSCFRCVTKGKSVKIEAGQGIVRGTKRKRSKGKKQGTASKRVFPAINAPPRQDFKFRNKRYPYHQPKKHPLTPLVDLPGLNFPRSFILDPMHLVFLGITKAILSILFLGGPHMLKPSLRQKVQNKLQMCVPFLPSEFPRKPSVIRNVGTCKAAEARIYLFYLGPVILKNSVDRNKYIHFMELSVAMRIYHQVTFCADDEARKLAKGLIQHFVESVPELYGEAYSSHNMHSLQHFPEDIEWFKDSIPNFTANDINAFPPENFNQVFRRFTRSYSKPLQQNFRRLAELFNTDFWQQKYKTGMDASEELKYRTNHDDGPLPFCLSGQQYKSVVFPTFVLSTNEADCTCGTEHGDIIIALNFVVDQKNNQQFVVGKKFQLKADFFDDPLPRSGKLGIYKVSKLSSIIEKWPLSCIKTKFVRLPYVKDETIPELYRREEFIVLPLIHTDTGPSTS